MKRFVAVGILALTLGCNLEHKENAMNSHGTHSVHQHARHEGAHGRQHSAQAEAELIVAAEPSAPSAGTPVTLKLMIHDADGTMVKNFDIVHGEKVHLVIVREGLDQFAHIHPTVDANGHLTVSHTFPVGGKYRLFADYTPLGDNHATATGALSVSGESPDAPPLVANAPGEIEGDGVRATVTAARLKATQPAHVAFAVRNDEGPTKLEPYLGALGHLMFVSVSRTYVHVHPVAGDADGGTVEFEARFPEPGLYKGWGQFKTSGQVRVIPFALKVE